MMNINQLRHDIYRLLSLAIPIIIAQLTMSGINVVNVIMAGHLGSESLAALSIGSNLWYVPLIFFTGVFMAISPIVSHQKGANYLLKDIGKFSRNALPFAVCIGVVWALCAYFLASSVVSFFFLNKTTADLTINYLHSIAWSAIPYCCFFVLRYTADALSYTKASLIAGAIAFVTNIISNWLFMFGHFGLPALGIAACGISTFLAISAMLLVYIVLYCKNTLLSQLHIFEFSAIKLDHNLLEISRIGFPIGIILLAETGMYVIATFMMSHFGDTFIAAHQIAINFAAICFIVPMGLGMATTILVGQASGECNFAKAEYFGKLGIGLGFIFSIFSACVMVIIPTYIVSLYIDVENVQHIAIRFLHYAAIFQIFDCVQTTASGALRGFKDTRMPMLLILFAYWLVALPLAYLLSFSMNMGPKGIWYGIAVGLGFAAIGLCFRYAWFCHHTRYLSFSLNTERR